MCVALMDIPGDMPCHPHPQFLGNTGCILTVLLGWRRAGARSQLPEPAEGDTRMEKKPVGTGMKSLKQIEAEVLAEGREWTRRLWM